MESLSLTFLTVSAIMNLLKALQTDSGEIATGPSVRLFKQIELAEKMFVVVLIIMIVSIEIHNARRK